MRIVAAADTEGGNGSKPNQDYFVLDDAASLYIVCDGIGGKAAGEVASQAAAEAVRRYSLERLTVLEAFDGSPSARDGLLRLVDESIQFACREVFRIATSEAGRAGMGTSFTAVVLAGDFGVMGHVGNSRLYLCRAGRTDQLSEDHTYSSEAVKRGLMTEEEAASGPYSKVMTRAVGVQSSVRTDTLLFDILPGDTLLLCSSGLYRTFRGTPPTSTLAGEELQAIPLRLRELAQLGPAEASGLVVVGTHEGDLAGRLDDVDGDGRHVVVRGAELG